MANEDRLKVLTDAQWAALEPLIEACRPRGKTQHHDLRRTIEAIIWRHDNGAKWRSIPADLGPWWMAAQTFNRWSHLGVWERLLEVAQEGGVELGMAFLDGTTIRAHQKAAGAARKGGRRQSGTSGKRSGARAAATARRPVSSLTAAGVPSASLSRRARRTSCRSPRTCSPASPISLAGWWATVGSRRMRSASTSGT
jgi:transposase